MSDHKTTQFAQLTPSDVLLLEGAPLAAKMSGSAAGGRRSAQASWRLGGRVSEALGVAGEVDRHSIFDDRLQHFDSALQFLYPHLRFFSTGVCRGCCFFCG